MFLNTKSIIELSSELLTQDTYRIPPKPLEAQKDDDQKVHVIDCSSEFAQAEFVKNQIIELMKSNPDYTFSDFAVLSRKQRDGLNTAQKSTLLEFCVNMEYQSKISQKLIVRQRLEHGVKLMVIIALTFYQISMYLI